MSRHSTAPPLGSRRPSSLRGKHPRVVDDHKVTRKEQIRQRRNECVAEVIAGAIEQQQAGAAALWSRILGDELRRKIEIELADIHPALPKSRRPDNSTSWT